MAKFDYFVCPIRYDDVKDHISMECERSPTFTLTEYNLPHAVQLLFSLVIFKNRFTFHTFFTYVMSNDVRHEANLYEKFASILRNRFFIFCFRHLYILRKYLIKIYFYLIKCSCLIFFCIYWYDPFW